MKKGYVILTLLFFLAYLPIWHWMLGRWMAPGSYFSHGFLIPMMSGYLIWRDRAKLHFDPTQGKGIGLFIVLGGLFVFLLSAFWQIYFTGAWSFLVVITGSLVYLYGWSPFRILWFPLAFLVFMIPIPLVMVADISLQLKLTASAVAIQIIDALGITAIRQGSYIHFTTGTMVVGDICSGLRSLIALLAFGAFFSYLSQLTKGRKVFLFLTSVPIAWVANLARILALCLIANGFGIKAATGFVHDASGILIFVVAFIFLFTVEKILRITLGKRGSVDVKS